MRRKESNSKDNSTHTLPAKRKFDAKRSIRALQKRVANLERAVADLTATRNAEFDELPQAERKRPGPKPRHGGNDPQRPRPIGRDAGILLARN
jgi:hypothetical protein